jgi:hypothetical protein
VGLPPASLLRKLKGGTMSKVFKHPFFLILGLVVATFWMFRINGVSFGDKSENIPKNISQIGRAPEQPENITQMKKIEKHKVAKTMIYEPGNVAPSLEVDTDLIQRDIDTLRNLQSYDPETICAVLNRVKNYISPECHEILEDLIKNHDDVRVREAAVLALGDQSYADALIFASEDPAPSVREIAVGKMMELENEEGQLIFKDPFKNLLMNENDTDVLETCLSYFDYYSQSPEQFIEMTPDFLERNDLPPEALMEYAEILSEYASPSNALDFLGLIFSSSTFKGLDIDLQNAMANDITKLFEE